ncbi:MAG TPA: hypothetical protein VJZ91_01580 [Blastocatellia bacterium]|nr:hypothetical protein [Blastocatellia bacterium]
MTVCNEIKRRIDEADDTESLDLDIERHTAACAGCRRFAGERAALRGLLGSTARVAAPVNFDAMLRARLDEVKARRGLAWLGAAFYLRAGAAAAALVVAVFAAQQMGWFSRSLSGQQAPQSAEVQAGVATPAPTQQTPLPVVPAQPASGNDAIALDSGSRPRAAAMPAGVYASNHARPHSPGARRGAGVPLMSPVDAAFVDSGAMIIPGRNGQRDVTVPTVSVGAQPLIYGNASRQPQAARAMTVSF